MSVRVQTWVWLNSKQPGGHRLVLLALADFANDAGICWPSVSTLAKYSLLSERQVFRVLAELRRSGDIEAVREGGGRSKTVSYRVVMRNPDNMSGFVNPDVGDSKTLTPASVNPDIHVTRSTIDPPNDPPLSARRKRRAASAYRKLEFKEQEWEEGALWLRRFLLEEQDTFSSADSKQLLDNWGWWWALDCEVGGAIEPELLRREFAGMKRWVIANPKRSPREDRILLFIANWLTRAADLWRRRNEVFQRQ